MLRAILFALAVGPAAVSAAADLPEIQKRGSLKVLVAADEYPEMFSFKAGTEPGLERELVEGFAKLHRLKIEVVPVENFDEIIPRLVKGEGDVITGIIDTEPRRAHVDFTSEILPARHLVITRKPTPPVATVEQLRKEKVGTVKGTSWAEAIADAGVPAARIEHFPETVALLAGLQSGRITAIVMSVSDGTLAMRKDPALQAGAFLGTPKSAAFAVRKGDDALERAINEYIDSVRKTPTWSRLVVKYFGKSALSVLGRAKKE